MTVVVALLTVAVAVLALLVAGLLRSHAAILRRLHELGAGLEPGPADSAALPASVGPPSAVTPDGSGAFDRARDLVGTGPAGDAVALRVAGVAHDTVLAFLSSGCATCRPFWDAFAADAVPGLPARTRLVVVTKGAADDSPAAIAALAPEHLPVVRTSQAWRDYAVPGAPYFVHVDGTTGRVRGQGTAADWDRVVHLLRQAGDDAATDPATGRYAKARADAEREADVDRVLLGAGITPDHPSLYPPRRDGPA